MNRVASESNLSGLSVVRNSTEPSFVVILACNTASAKALRTIQQHVLPITDPDRRVLGVIRPTVEILGKVSRTRHIGLLATPGTVMSHSYAMEIEKIYPVRNSTEPSFVHSLSIAGCLRR